jgi:hypothetical protein
LHWGFAGIIEQTTAQTHKQATTSNMQYTWNVAADMSNCFIKDVVGISPIATALTSMMSLCIIIAFLWEAIPTGSFKQPRLLQRSRLNSHCVGQDVKHPARLCSQMHTISGHELLLIWIQVSQNWQKVREREAALGSKCSETFRWLLALLL